MKQKHTPVLLDHVISLLQPKPGESYLDLTAGYGGHASVVTETIGDDARVVLVDRDRTAVQELNARFGDRAEIIRGDYESTAQSLLDDGSLFDMILMDLGVSSPQLDEAERGFSFQKPADLDMRMDQNQHLSAMTVVNEYSEKDLADIIYRYGEERKSRQIAHAIMQERPIATTTELADIVRRVVPRSGDTDPATRTFQAIRIEVNDELGSLARTLPIVNRLLSPGGRLAIISFHSLEDRIVKTFMATESRDCICPPKQPICTCGHIASLTLLGKAVLGSKQDVSNPRARSATLRAAANKNQNKRRST